MHFGTIHFLYTPKLHNGRIKDKECKMVKIFGGVVYEENYIFFTDS